MRWENKSRKRIKAVVKEAVKVATAPLLKQNKELQAQLKKLEKGLIGSETKIKDLVHKINNKRNECIEKDLSINLILLKIDSFNSPGCRTCSVLNPIRS